MPHAFCSTYGTCAHPLLGDGSPRLALHPQLVPRRVRRGSGTAVPRGLGCGSAPRGYGFRLHTTQPARSSPRIPNPEALYSFLGRRKEDGASVVTAGPGSPAEKQAQGHHLSSSLHAVPRGTRQHPDVLCAAATPRSRLAEGLLALNTSTSHKVPPWQLCSQPELPRDPQTAAAGDISPWACSAQPSGTASAPCSKRRLLGAA